MRSTRSAFRARGGWDGFEHIIERRARGRRPARSGAPARAGRSRALGGQPRLLRGGEGDDRLVFSGGQDTIRNFNDSSDDDQIDLRSFAGLDTFADVREHLTQSGGHVFFNDGTASLKIEWTSLSSLGVDDFIW